MESTLKAHPFSGHIDIGYWYPQTITNRKLWSLSHGEFTDLSPLFMLYFRVNLTSLQWRPDESSPAGNVFPLEFAVTFAKQRTGGKPYWELITAIRALITKANIFLIDFGIDLACLLLIFRDAFVWWQFEGPYYVKFSMSVTFLCCCCNFCIPSEIAPVQCEITKKE